MTTVISDKMLARLRKALEHTSDTEWVFRQDTPDLVPRIENGDGDRKELWWTTSDDAFCVLAHTLMPALLDTIAHLKRVAGISDPPRHACPTLPTLQEYVRDNPCQGFHAVPHYSVLGDFVEYFFEDVRCVARPKTNFLTFYHATDDDRLVGVKVHSALSYSPVRRREVDNSDNPDNTDGPVAP